MKYVGSYPLFVLNSINFYVQDWGILSENLITYD